jgi:hypothetical protein
MQQGSLFKLLNRIASIAPLSDSVSKLVYAYHAECSWTLGADGRLYRRSGELVPAKEIRDMLSGPNGVVPRRGELYENAVFWAKLHSDVFADPATREIQKDFAIDYLVNTQRSFETQAYGSINPLVTYVSENANPSEAVALSYASDLAFCVYHAHSVNGPAPALSVLNATCKKVTHDSDPYRFAQTLIRGLGLKKYGHWEDTVDGRNRYDRTRYYAKASGLWPESLFVGKGAIMPADLTR